MEQQLSAQQQLVLDQQLKLADESYRTGDHLDDKAATLLQASSIVTGLTGVVAIPAFIAQPTSIFALVALGFAFIFFVGMILAALCAWLPSGFATPGATDWDDVYNNYLNQDVETCFRQLLSDTREAHDRSRVRNARKSRLVRASLVLFALQIVGILGLALLSAQIVP